MKFEFNNINILIAEQILTKYPIGKEASALVPLLDLAQRQYGWLSQEVIEYVANFIKIPIIRAYEVASFYTMFNLKPVGEYLLQVCTTTPCWLKGSDSLVDLIKEKLNINFNETTKDNLFTLKDVECLGACINSPVIQINDDYYEDLSAESLSKIIDKLKKGHEC